MWSKLKELFSRTTIINNEYKTEYVFNDSSIQYIDTTKYTSDDLIVLSTDAVLSEKLLTQLRADLKGRLPCPAIILMGGLKLSILTKDQLTELIDRTLSIDASYLETT